VRIFRGKHCWTSQQWHPFLKNMFSGAGGSLGVELASELLLGKAASRMRHAIGDNAEILRFLQTGDHRVSATDDLLVFPFLLAQGAFG
jgi:hypothetical protein